MQTLVIVLSMAVAIALLPFLKGEDSPFRQRSDAESEASAYQLETFARAAWHLARTGVTGPLQRSQMVLPAGFADNPASPYQARAEGGFLYVWETNSSAADKRQALGQELIFPTGDHTVSVGIRAGQYIRFRDGSIAPRPTWLPDSPPNRQLVVVRLRI